MNCFFIQGGNWIVNIKDYFGNIKKAIQPEE